MKALAEGEKREKEANNLFEEILAEEFPKRHLGPRSPETSNSDKPKESHTKKHYN